MIKHSYFNEKGEWVPDPTPIEIPIGLKRPPSMNERIKEMVRGALSQSAVNAGRESFEEANDFSIPDPDGSQLPISPHELKDAEDEVPVEEFIRRRGIEIKEEAKKKEEEKNVSQRHSQTESDVDSRVDRRAGASSRRASGRPSRRDRRRETTDHNPEYSDNAEGS